VTTKRKRSSAAAPITGVATGNLGTAANLDDTQVFKTADLDAQTPGWLDDDGPSAAVAPAPAYEAPPARPASPRTSQRQRSGQRDRGRNLALIGAGALAMLVLLAGGGILSQLDLGASGVEPSGPAFGITTEPSPAATAEPQAEGGKGHGHDGCRGKHCD
jgi:hypothetical protein